MGKRPRRDPRIELVLTVRPARREPYVPRKGACREKATPFDSEPERTGAVSSIFFQPMIFSGMGRLRGEH
jgi:hypothetical protein